MVLTKIDHQCIKVQKKKQPNKTETYQRNTEKIQFYDKYTYNKTINNQQINCIKYYIV